MKSYLLLFFLINSCSFFAQDASFSFSSFDIKINGSKILTEDKNGAVLYEKNFEKPASFFIDLDGDNIDEFLVVDSLKKNEKLFFTLFIYNTIDAFYLVDSVYSGSIEPYNAISEEIGSIIIISGNSEFDIFNEQSDINVLPVNYWKYESGELFRINDEIYNGFINENDNLIEILENYISEDGSDCNVSLKLKSVIASAFANFINADEEAAASQLLSEYYLCEDVDQFKNQMLALLKKGNFNEDGME